MSTSHKIFLLSIVFYNERGIVSGTDICMIFFPPVPLHLTIPDAYVDTSIVGVGLTSKGNLDVPHNYVDVGWYKYGPMPGETGSVVLDGHVDNGATIPGPFKHLKDLEKGDNISVAMSDGSQLHYTIVSFDVYKTDAFPSQKVFAESGKKYLKLITCHGKFVAIKGTYDQRLVVTAVLS